jgi:cytochrome c oxidase assembly protein subunit 11
MDREVHTVTLSYTFFDTGMKEQAASLRTGQPHG